MCDQNDHVFFQSDIYGNRSNNKLFHHLGTTRRSLDPTLKKQWGRIFKSFGIMRLEIMSRHHILYEEVVRNCYLGFLVFLSSF